MLVIVHQNGEAGTCPGGFPEDQRAKWNGFQGCRGALRTTTSMIHDSTTEDFGKFVPHFELPGRRGSLGKPIQQERDSVRFENFRLSLHIGFSQPSGSSFDQFTQAHCHHTLACRSQLKTAPSTTATTTTSRGEINEALAHGLPKMLPRGTEASRKGVNRAATERSDREGGCGGFGRVLMQCPKSGVRESGVRSRSKGI